MLPQEEQAEEGHNRDEGGEREELAGELAEAERLVESAAADDEEVGGGEDDPDEAPEPFQWGLDLGIDLRYVLHGAQDFTYHRMAYAGERLTATSTIAEVYTKRGGALEFVVKKTAITDESGALVADLACTIVVRHPEVAA